MKHFGTFFDINYLSRGLVLYQSLVKVEPDFKLYILCLDDETFSFLQKQLYKQVILVPISELENFDKELFESKSHRKLVEYYFTISPCWPLYLIQKYNIPHICTLDADICFYSSPNEIFSNLDSYSIIITPHKFSKELEHFELYGKFNVSFQIFKNNVHNYLIINTLIFNFIRIVILYKIISKK